MTNSTPGSLVEVTPVTGAPLSRYYANSEYRLGGEQTVARWTKLAKPPAKSHCDECSRVQHETAGTFGPRMQPRYRRTIPNGPKLTLCGRHAEAWRERDGKDTPSLADYWGRSGDFPGSTTKQRG